MSVPDPAELDALADRIAGHADAARARAARLAAAVARARWHGIAAGAFFAEAHLVVAALRSSADRLDDAAAALRAHAARVRAVLADLAALGADGRALLRDAVTDPTRLPGDVADLVGDGVHLVGDALSALGF